MKTNFHKFAEFTKFTKLVAYENLSFYSIICQRQNRRLDFPQSCEACTYKSHQLVFQEQHNRFPLADNIVHESQTEQCYHGYTVRVKCCSGRLRLCRGRPVLSIATKIVSVPPVRGILQGGQQVSSTILMYTEKRGRGTILVAIESTLAQRVRRTMMNDNYQVQIYPLFLKMDSVFCRVVTVSTLTVELPRRLNPFSYRFLELVDSLLYGLPAQPRFV